MSGISPYDNYISGFATIAAVAAGGAAVAIASRVGSAFSSANVDTPNTANPLNPERVFSHAEILEILKREDVLANPNAPVKEWGIPPLLKIAELLVQFQSIRPDSLLGGEVDVRNQKSKVTENLQILLKCPDPSITAAARSCMQTLEEGVHENLPKELAEATKELIDRGADPLAPGVDGECALQKAASVTNWSIYPTVLLTMAHPKDQKLKKSDVDKISIPQEVKDNKNYLYTIAFINALKGGEDISAFGSLFDEGEKVRDPDSYTPKYTRLPPVINPDGYYKGKSFLYYAVKHGRLDVLEFLREKGASNSLKLKWWEWDERSNDARVKDPLYECGYKRDSLPKIHDFFKYAAEKEDLYLFGALLKFIDDPAKREKKCRLFDERTANSERVRSEKRKQRLAIHAGVANPQNAFLPPEILNKIGEMIHPLPSAASGGKNEA